MKDLEHASINGVEIRNLAEQDNDETLLYSGEIWLDGVKIGSLTETESGMEISVAPESEDALNERVASYLNAVAADNEEEDEDDDFEMNQDVFFEDLIELELYLPAFKEGVKEGYGCLLVNYTDEGVDVFSVESEDEVENIARENNLTNFQTFYELDHFVINC
jgi:hypothetical protein